MRLKMKPNQKLILQAALIGVMAGASLGPVDALAKSKKQPGDSGVEKQLRFKEGDETGNELKALKTEFLVMSSEKKALDQLQRLEKRYKGTRMEPEILFRLAELYMRRARTERFFEIHRSSEQVLTYAPQMVKDASEAGEIRRAISIYNRIQKDFPHFHTMDVVIFNSAYAHQQIGDDKEAEKLFSRLIATYPRSPLVPDSHMAIGEINYARRNFVFALENFKAIRKFPRARVYPYGMYKAAWSYYNMQDAPAGMKQLEDVVKFGREVAVKKLDSKLDLRKEALNDMALYFGDVMTSDKAVDYFMAQAQELDPAPYLLRLVELYKRHSRYQDIETVLRGILNKMPDSPAVATAHEELIWNYERTKNQSKAVEQLAAMDVYCDKLPLSAEAKKLKKGDPDARKECENKVADTSKKLATKWHALWKRQGGAEGGKGQLELSATAEKAYRLFLKSADPKDVELPTIRFAFAELTFARGQFREASQHYAAIEEYQKQGVVIDPKVSHDAAYGAVLSLERAVSDKWNDADEKRFIELSESYVRRFPKGDFVLDLRFKRAFIAYEKERYDEAGAQFKAIGWAELPKGAPVPEKVVKAQDLYLDILNIRKDYTTLKEAAQALIGRQTDGARTVQIQKIYREAYFAEIQQLEEKGELEKAVEAYKKFALENTTSDLAPKAWWNASQLQFRMGDATGGANTCYQMHKLFPKSSNGKDCLTQAAQTFESMARLDLAARVLLNLALVEPEKQNKWREVAADFFALSGGQSRAIPMYMKLAEGQKPAAQIPYLERAAALARDTGDLKALAQIESEFTRMGIEPQASRLVVEQIEESFQKGDHTKAFNLSKKIIGRSGLPKELQARARLVQARVLDDEYKKQSLKARMDRIGLVLAIKTEKLEKAQKAYQSAINYGDAATSVKALQSLAGCYIDYAKTVRGMSLPASVSKADADAFRAEIEQLAIPMEEKGIESMAQALDVAKKAQLREGQIASLQKDLDRLNMKSDTAPEVKVPGPGIYVPEFKAAAFKIVSRMTNSEDPR
jgi:cellulose synthase operon protein C